MLNEVLQPLESKLVACVAIVSDSESLIALNTIFLVPGRDVVLANKDDEQWDHPANNIDSIDQCHLLAVTWLNSLRSASYL
jgi:hypothetical protein